MAMALLLAIATAFLAAALGAFATGADGVTLVRAGSGRRSSRTGDGANARSSAPPLTSRQRIDDHEQAEGPDAGEADRAKHLYEPAHRSPGRDLPELEVSDSRS
jgi:hypothetical protein